MGRHKSCKVHEHFTYVTVRNISVCKLCPPETDVKVKELKGKVVTNYRDHLKRYHTTEYELVLQAEAQQKSNTPKRSGKYLRHFEIFFGRYGCGKGINFSYFT